MVKNFVLNNMMNVIIKNNSFSAVKLEEIKYGLEAIYLLISKSIIIISLAFILNIAREFLIFSLFYNIIRMPSFGLHATKSWICLLSSSLIFILAPYLASILTIDIYIKIIVSIICILLIFKNAPADTYKKPIISKKRRLVYKYISVVISIVYALISTIIIDGFFSNVLILSLVVQNFMISPTIYKLFNLPYNNYLNYSQA